jgi:hypothetical protein
VNITQALQDFFNSPAGQAAFGMLVIGGLDLLLGVAAAFRDNTFQLEAVSAWLRSNLAGKIFPIWMLLFVGHFTSGLAIGDIPLLLTAGIGAAALYTAGTLGSILASWGPNRSIQPVPDE